MPDDGGEPPPAPTSNDREVGSDNKKKKKNFRRNKSASWESKNEEIKLSTFSLNNTEKIKQSLQDIAEYVTTSWDYGHDIGQSLLQYAKVPIDEPVDPGPSPSKKDEYKWSKQMDLCIKREAKLDENLQKAHGLLIGQCDPAMRAKVEADADYEASAKEGDALKLLEIIKRVGTGARADVHPAVALYNSNVRLMSHRQKRRDGPSLQVPDDGRKQKKTVSKQDSSSPTVMTESLFVSLVQDAMEKRDVATSDIPGAFLQTDMEGVVRVRITGPLAELLVQIAPEQFADKVVIEGGKMVIYARLQKAMYGNVIASLLFWRDLVKTLCGWGFEANPYDPCVMNKMIDGKQCTVLWHVDDIKCSHVDANVVTKVLDDLDGVYGAVKPLARTRGKKHVYLGMEFDLSVEGKVIITMKKYIDEILAKAPKDMDGTISTPAANHLFQVRDEGKPLPPQMKEDYTSLVAMLLFLCCRARPDLKTAVSFLTTRHKSPDWDDWKKLGRTIRYLRGTKDLPLTLEANRMNVMEWWVDASFAVHPDMRSHTGGAMTFKDGKGAVISNCSKQKLNSKSSTIAELIATDDVLPKALWTRNFVQAQGIDVTDNIMYQDNQSAILLERNGKYSCSKRTRHIDIRYFYITDRIRAKDLRVEYCPTEDMIGDFFTKPLQGALFRRHRAKLLNLPE